MVSDCSSLAIGDIVVYLGSFPILGFVEIPKMSDRILPEPKDADFQKKN